MINQGTWTAALGRLQLEVSDGHFAAWLRESTFVKGGNSSLVVGLPNAFARETVDRNLRPIVKEVVDDIAACNVDVTFVIHADEASRIVLPADVSEPASPRSPSHHPPATAQPRTEAPLQPRYTFDNFVSGEGSNLAYAAAKRACEAPGGAYNPLFIHGGVGLGKTHLLKSIGYEIGRQRPSFSVHFVTSEDFTHELVTAIRSGSTTAFRARYRSADVLLMDDVQFIAGREATQQEMFHTFDRLYGDGKQLVLTSDCSPQAIRPLSDRLTTRFACGLVADIQPPNYETRLAILQRKAHVVAVEAPLPVLQFLASSITENVRELEGALTRVIFFAQCHKLELSLGVAEQALQHTAYRSSPQVVSLPAIVAATCRHFGLIKDDMLSPSRETRLTRPRHIAMFLMREYTSHSLPAIGNALGGRDHTTILYGIRKISRQISGDPELASAVDSVRTIIADPANYRA